MTRTATALSLSVLLAACQPSAPVAAPVSAPTVAAEVALGPEIKSQQVQTLAKFTAQGSLHAEGQSVTLQLRLPPLSQNTNFATQALNVSEAQTVVLSLKDANDQVYLPQGAEATPEGGELPYPVDGNLNVRFNGVFPSALLLASFHVLDAQKQVIPQTQLATAFSHLKDTDADVQINFSTTPAAQVLSRLLASTDPQVRLRALAINPSDLQLLTDNIWKPDGNPLLVNVLGLTDALKNLGPESLRAFEYRLSGAKVNVRVNGLVAQDTVQMQLTDAFTPVVKNQGNTGADPYVFTGVPAANGLRVLVASTPSPGTDYNFSVSPTSLNVDVGSYDVVVTATPARPVLTQLSSTSGTIGNEVTLTGTQFHQTIAGNGVKFGTQSAEVTSASTTELKVKVPAGIAGQVNVTVSVGSQTSEATRTYSVVPVLSEVSPNAGASAGGTAVVIKGSGFTGATAVKFGTTAATSFKVDSNTQITAVAPAGTLGATDITVVTAGGTSATGAASKYTYSDSKGFVITGLTPVQGSVLAKPITPLGDMNGDGIDDFAVCDLNASSPAKYLNSGKVYVIYGGFTGKTLDVTALTPEQGFVIEGNNFDQLWSVASAGDVNGDGKPDMIIGAPGFSFEDSANNDFRPQVGRSYVVYGGSFSGAGLELKDLNSTQGFSIVGVSASERSGRAVAGAGDVNGDGKDDVIIGAELTDLGDGSEHGRSYVVYGGVTGGPVDLKTITATQGFRIVDASSGARLGAAVKGLGDVNGDGKDDIIVGAPGANSAAGESYVIYGGVTAINFSVSTLKTGDGSQGFVIENGDTTGYVGAVIGNPGDVSGDGKPDILLGEPSFIDDRGIAHIIYGGFTGSSLSLYTASSGQGMGTRLSPLYFGGGIPKFGTALSAAGDVNGDGKPDFIVGAPAADGGDGYSYVFYGPITVPFNLSTNGSNNFIIKGPEGFAGNFGRGVAGIGDINGDGKADLAASDEVNNLGFYSQKIYVIYGGANQGSGSFKVDDL
jgi:hypothetical protein